MHLVKENVSSYAGVPDLLPFSCVSQLHISWKLLVKQNTGKISDWCDPNLTLQHSVVTQIETKVRTVSPKGQKEF